MIFLVSQNFMQVSQREMHFTLEKVRTSGKHDEPAYRFTNSRRETNLSAPDGSSHDTLHVDQAANGCFPISPSDIVHEDLPSSRSPSFCHGRSQTIPLLPVYPAVGSINTFFNLFRSLTGL